MQQRDDLWTRRSHHRDPPVDVMPALRKPEPGSGLVSATPPPRARAPRRRLPTSAKPRTWPGGTTATDWCGATRCRERISPHFAPKKSDRHRPSRQAMRALDCANPQRTLAPSGIGFPILHAAHAHAAGTDRPAGEIHPAAAPSSASLPRRVCATRLAARCGGRMGRGGGAARRRAATTRALCRKRYGRAWGCRRAERVGADMAGVSFAGEGAL